MTSSTALRILAVTGGHRIDTDAFTGMLATVCGERGWVFAHAVQPSAQAWLTTRHADSFDAILCYDLPGIALSRGSTPTAVGPDSRVTSDLVDLLEYGQGMVFLHHALAGFPGWDGWAGVLGGRYHYAPATLRGIPVPDDGYRYASYTARVLATDHPVCAGITDFALEDELYCCPMFGDEVVPLLATDADPSADLFRSTLREVLGTGEDEPWVHPPASDLIAWAKVAGRSPIAYLQPGDGPATLAHPTFQRLVGNALAWVASADAHRWAAENRKPIDPMPTTTSSAQEE